MTADSYARALSLGYTRLTPASFHITAADLIAWQCPHCWAVVAYAGWEQHESWHRAGKWHAEGPAAPSYPAQEPLAEEPARDDLASSKKFMVEVRNPGITSVVETDLQPTQQAAERVVRFLALPPHSPAVVTWPSGKFFLVARDDLYIKDTKTAPAPVDVSYIKVTFDPEPEKEDR